MTMMWEYNSDLKFMHYGPFIPTLLHYLFFFIFF